MISAPSAHITSGAPISQALIDELEHGIIDPRVDDVRIYPVCANTEVWCLGRQQPLTLEIFLSEAGAEAAEMPA